MINRAATLVWRTSSQNNASCVEVAFDGDTVLLRDTKDNRLGAVHRLTPDQWVTFLDETTKGLTSDNGAIEVVVGEMVARYDGGLRVEMTQWHVRSLSTGEILHFRDDEWQSFKDGAEQGKFADLIASAELASR
jgi:hypothetical protein